MNNSVVTRNALSNYLRFILSMATMFLLTPYILRKVGAQDFGLWSLTFSIVGFLGLLDMGFGASAVKYVAEFRGKNDPEGRNRMVSTLLLAYIVLAVIATTGMALLSLAYQHLFHIPTLEMGKAIALLWIIGVRSVVLALPLGLYQGILFGEQKIAQINMVQIVTNLLYALLTWRSLASGGGILLLAWINLAIMGLEHAWYFLLCTRYLPDLQISVRLANKALLREAVVFSSAQMVINLSALIRLRTDPILVQMFMSLSAVALYTVALRVAESSLLLTKQAINVLAPLIAQLNGAGRIEQIRSTFLSASRWTFAGASLITIPICLFANEILKGWAGKEFGAAVPTLIVLMLSMWFVIPQMVATNVLAMTGHHTWTARMGAVSAIVNILVSLALVRPLGLAGVALGTLASTIVVDLGMVVTRTCRLYNVNTKEYLKVVFAPVLLPALAQSALCLGISSQFHLAHLGVVLIAVALSGLLFIAVYAISGLSSHEKAGFRAKYRRGSTMPIAEL